MYQLTPEGLATYTDMNGIVQETNKGPLVISRLGGWAVVKDLRGGMLKLTRT